MKTATAPLPPLRSVKVLDQLRERIRYLHYSLRTEQAYVHWVRAFIRFHGVRHPATLGSSEVEAFLSWLANERKVSISTHRQALAALLFFYGKVLCTDLPWLQEIGRPRPSRRLPVVLTPDEVVRILGFLEGEHRLFAQLLYGTGMRISEGLQLRVKDLDFDHGTIIVREGKGSKDRALMLPESLAPSLREQLSRARAWWALLQRLAAVRGRLSLCADQAAAAKWWLSMPMASVSAEGPMPKALSTRRTSPLMPGCRHQGRACPLRRARMTSNPLIVA